MAFVIVVLAGLSTGLGGLLACFIEGSKPSYFSVLLGLSAGVMIYISFVELLAVSIERTGFFYSNMAFIAGMGGIYLVDKFIPHFHLDRTADGFQEKIGERERIYKTGVLVAIGLAIHNFPEGIAVFMVSLESISLGLPLAIAIAIHNIPEGIAVAVPVYRATGSRNKSSLYSLLSGFTEPLGAVIAVVLLLPFLTQTILYLTYSAVAGVMIFISFDELLPISMRYGDEHTCCMGLFTGILIIILILSVF